MDPCNPLHQEHCTLNPNVHASGALSGNSKASRGAVVSENSRAWRAGVSGLGCWGQGLGFRGIVLSPKQVVELRPSHTKPPVREEKYLFSRDRQQVSKVRARRPQLEGGCANDPCLDARFAAKRVGSVLGFFHALKSKVGRAMGFVMSRSPNLQTNGPSLCGPNTSVSSPITTPLQPSTAQALIYVNE